MRRDRERKKGRDGLSIMIGIFFGGRPESTSCKWWKKDGISPKTCVGQNPLLVSGGKKMEYVPKCVCVREREKERERERERDFL